MKTFRKMLKIELKLSIRDMNMIIFAIAMPLIVLIILGLIYGNKPASEGADYTFIEQSFAALCCISICAGGLMGLPLLVSEYRERKILKRFKVTPVSPVMILSVHLCIYALYSVASLIILWICAGVFLGFELKGSFVMFIIIWFLVLVSMLSIGLLVGGLSSNSKTASIWATALYFPMLIFSGATLPYEVMPRVMQRIVDVLPLTQGIKLLKAATLGLPMNDVLVSAVVMIVIAVVCIFLSVRFFRWEA